LNISPAGAAAAAAANAAAVASPTVGSNAAQADGVVVAAAVAGVAPLARAMSTEDSAWGDSDATEPTEVTDEQIAGMNWQQLRAAIDSCSRCGLCKHARARVHGSGARNARWLVAAGASTALDEAEGQALAGDPGKLLTNMLGALSLSRENDVYVTNLIKCRSVTASGAERAPSAEEAAACRPYLERELALSGAGTVLTLGQIAANGLLGKPLQTALAGSRGKVHQLANVRLIATLHPGELLRRGADKALAWADLCLARAAANEPAG
jgi:uracil-DNA glycosylase family 4